MIITQGVDTQYMLEKSNKEQLLRGKVRNGGGGGEGKGSAQKVSFLALVCNHHYSIIRAVDIKGS